MKKKFYLWLKSQPCIVCGQEADPVYLNEADHVRIRSDYGGLFRSHKKYFAYAALPLCRRCHREKHEGPFREEEFYASKGVDIYFELANLLTRFLYHLESEEEEG